MQSLAIPELRLGRDSEQEGTDCKSVIRGFESHLGLAKTALALAPGPILRAACAARTRMVSDVQDAPQDAQ